MDGLTRTIAFLMLLLAGCARPCGLGPPVCQPTVSPCQQVPLVDAPGRLVPDLSEVPPVSPEPLPWQSGAAPRAYRPLDKMKVQCCAAASSGVANAMAAEARLIGPQSECATAKARAAALHRQILICRSVDNRNRAAADGLKLFYALAEAHAGRDLLDETHAELRTMAGYIEQLRAQGVQFEADAGAVRRQQLGAYDSRIAVELALAKANVGLQHLVGLKIDEATPIWPAADLRVVDVPVDVELAVADGMRYRSDLALLRVMYCSLDADVLDAVRAGLGQFSSALGASPGAHCFLAGCLAKRQDETEVQARRRQLARLLADQQQLATAEIRQAARTVEARLGQIVLARAQMESLEKHRDGLIAKRGAPDGPTAFDVSEAKLQIVEARRNVLHQVIAWRQAQARLKQTQGLLALECGYRLPATRRCCP